MEKNKRKSIIEREVDDSYRHLFGVARADSSYSEDELDNQINLEKVFLMYRETNGFVKWVKIVEILENEGIVVQKHPILRKIIQSLKNDSKRFSNCLDDVSLTSAEFKQLLEDYADFIIPGLLKALVIPNFDEYSIELRKIFEKARSAVDGEVMNDYPDLWEVNSSHWGVSLVSIHGQRANMGHHDVPFPLKELCGPMLWGLAMDIAGSNMVDYYIEKENLNFTDDLHLSPSLKAEDPFGRIAMVILCSLIRTSSLNKMTDVQKHDYLLYYLKAMTGGEHLKFNNASYSAEKEQDHNWKAVACYLAASERLNDDSFAALDLLLQVRSMEVTCESVAMLAATLANGGVSLTTGEPVLSALSVRSLLHTISVAGLGKSSSSYMFQVGVPAKSSTTGAMMLVVPGVLGMGLYSPKIVHDCSFRSFTFLKEMMAKLDYNPFSGLNRVEKRVKVKGKGLVASSDMGYRLFKLIAEGNLKTVKAATDMGLDLENIEDEYGETALHIAAANGQLDMVRYIHRQVPNLLFKLDKWKRTALKCAMASGSASVMDYLKQLETTVQPAAFQKKMREDSKQSDLSNNRESSKLQQKRSSLSNRQ